MPRRSRLAASTAALMLAAVALAGCDSGAEQESGAPQQSPAPQQSEEPEQSGEPSDDEAAQQSRSDEASSSGRKPRLTLAFAGDVHFENDLAGLLDDREATLGPMSRHLRNADLAMVNLETALATGGQPTDKELEDPSLRYWFRAPPRALDLLDRSGVDVVSLGNNHGADYGAAGLRESLAAAADSPVAVVGVGRNAEEAFSPYRVTVKGTDIAVLAADAAFRESADPIWAAGEGGPGLASARERPPKQLANAVREAARTDDLVVVYLHWGRSGQQCPTDQQRRLAERMASAGADIVVGSHAHVLLGAGMLGDTYVSYGLGNFLWYHGAKPRTGVLKVHVRGDQVVGDSFVPARIPPGGGPPRGFGEDRRAEARAQWEELRGCADLRPVPEPQPEEQESSDDGDELPGYEARIREIGPRLRDRMSDSHDPATCPVDLADLRHLRLSYVGFDGRHHTGELVVHADHAEDVVGVFEELYDARWPIRRMRLVDEYGADDDRSMAADNTSAYNCRRVAGQDTWSAHAYGAAIDLNPVENPYVVDGEVRPPDGRRFADVDRSADADTRPGVIQEGDVVMRAFERIGWTWGGRFSEPDYQHFAAR